MDLDLDILHPSKEVLTPYKLVTAILVREYVRLRRDLAPDSPMGKPSSGSKEKERDECRNYLSRAGIDLDRLVLSAREAFDTVRILQHLMRSTERPFAYLINLIRPIICRAHLLLFQRIIDILKKDDPEETLKYIENSLESCVKQLSAKTDSSPGALYIRQARLLFNEMTIGNLERFNVRLLEYIDAGYHPLESNADPKILSTFKKPELCSRSSKISTVPSSDFILQQESNLILNNPSLAGDGPRHDGQLSQIYNAKPVTENVQYVHFLDCVRRKDFGQAVSILHKFFDLKTVQEDMNHEQGAGAACLHLCIIHYNAGHLSLAMRFLQECIFIAQEKGDIQLLTSAMYWVAVLEVNNNQYEKLLRGYRGSDVATFPETKSLFASLLTEFDTQAEAPPARILQDLECLDKAEFVNIIPVLGQYTSRATFWKAYGFDVMSSIYAQANVQIFPRECYGKFPMANDSVALSANFLLENAIRLHDDDGLENILDYCNDIFSVERFPNWQIWGFTVLVWKYQRAFHQQDYDVCDSVVKQMTGINLPEATIRKAELLFFKECSPLSALELIDNMLLTCQSVAAHVKNFEFGSTMMELRLLLLKVDILTRTNCGLEALEACMRALGLTADHPNDLWRAKVQLHLACVWQHIGEYSLAENLLECCFPVLVGCRFALDQAKCWFLKGQLLWQKTCIGQQPNRQMSETVVKYLEKALTEFTTCLAIENILLCLHLLITVHDWNTAYVERDQYIQKFLKLTEKYPVCGNISLSV